jgi:hypothetical protein
MVREIMAPDTGLAFAAMSGLRPQVPTEDAFVCLVNDCCGLRDTWLADEGHRLGCDQLHLDSGVGPERIDAHAYRNGVTATASARVLPRAASAGAQRDRLAYKCG